MTTRLYEPGNTLGNQIADYCGLHPHQIGLPRGCLDEAIELLRSNGANEEVEDKRHVGRPLDVKFLGTLHDVQTAAVAAIEPHEHGVLAATTAFGKTVVAARTIAARGVNTLRRSK